VDGLTLEGVAIPIHIEMNWNPSYSYARIPPGLENIPPYYKILTTPVPAAEGMPHFSNVHIWNIKATGARRAFDVSAMPEAPLVNFRLDHIAIDAQSAGRVADASDWTLTDVSIHAADGSQLTFSHSTGLKMKDDSGIAAPAAK